MVRCKLQLGRLGGARHLLLQLQYIWRAYSLGLQQPLCVSALNIHSAVSDILYICVNDGSFSSFIVVIIPLRYSNTAAPIAPTAAPTAAELLLQQFVVRTPSLNVF